MLELLFSFKRVYLTGHRHLLAALRAHGLTPARLDVMRLVLEGIATQKALRRALGIARSTISRMLSGMEKRGLIVRTSKAAQRATKHVAISPGLAQELHELTISLEGAVSAGIAQALGIRPGRVRGFIDGVVALELGLCHARHAWADRSSRLETPIIGQFDI